MTANIVTDVGKNQVLASAFVDTGNQMTEAVKFGYMALGLEDVEFSKDDIILTGECTRADYHRVAITSLYDNAGTRVALEGLFDTENIESSTIIRSVGICDQETGGNFFCLCRLPDIDKSSSSQLRITITVKVE